MFQRHLKPFSPNWWTSRARRPAIDSLRTACFEEAAISAKRGRQLPAVIAVYEKLHAGIWVFNGFFSLVDAWLEDDGRRQVFKFKLELLDGAADAPALDGRPLEHS